MNKKQFQYAITLVGLLLLFLLISCAGSHPHGTEHLSERRGKPKVGVAGLEKQIHVLINMERRRHGLPLFEWNAKLADIARKHSRDMGQRNYFAHTSLEGHDFLYRYEQEGYACGTRVGTTIYKGAENIALNNLYDSITTVNGAAYYDWNSQEKIAETTVQGWMKSPGHKNNILTPYFKAEGIGVVIAPDDKVYITQNFC